MHDLVIIGSGPAGFTAAIYAARAQLKPVLIASPVGLGGELMTTTEVENFPGFPAGIQGPDLMAQMQEQAEKFGTGIIYDDVESLDLTGPVKTIKLAGGDTLEARAVIFATGSAHRKLGVTNEERLSGYGVSYCATCDGFFFKEKHVVVVGGGDTAMEEALFLTKFASKVTVIHRSNTLKASKIMQERAFAHEKIEFIWDAEVIAAVGDTNLEAVNVFDHETGYDEEIPADGLFIAIGNDPRTHLVHDQLDLTEHGTIAVKGRTSATNIAGVFAAGDVIDHSYRQAVTAAASGTVAALDAERWLAGH